MGESFERKLAGIEAKHHDLEVKLQSAKEEIAK
jgi:hypothetical protein